MRTTVSPTLPRFQYRRLRMRVAAFRPHIHRSRGYIKYKNRLIGKLYFDAGILVRFKGMVPSRAYLPTTGNTPGDDLYVCDQYHRWICAGQAGSTHEKLLLTLIDLAPAF